MCPGNKTLMRETGTSHLMAISGLHITLAASIIWTLAVGFQFYCRVSGSLADASACGTVFAAFYAWLTGLQPPALRTVIALAVLAALRIGARQWSAWQVWCSCIAAILIVDPLAVLSQSPGVVSVCCRGVDFLVSVAATPSWRWTRRVRPTVNLLYLQVGMLLLLLPLQVLMFHGFSVSSLVANLFAVPLVTFISVPLILLGMLLHLLPLVSTETGVWFAADKSPAGLFWLLQRLPDGWQDVDERWQYLTLLPRLAIIGWRFRSRKACRRCV